MDIEKLKSFGVLAEELHFGRASVRLGVAQPHLSRRIQDLERHVGVALFVRTPRRVDLTAAGAALASRLGPLLAGIEQACQDARDVAAGRGGRLRIGFIHSTTYGILPAILRAFRAACPDITLDLREMTILVQVAALRAGEIDLGILRPLPEAWDLAHEVILRERFLLAVPDGHPLARRRAVSLRDLGGEPLILFPRESSPLFYGRITAAFEAAGLIPNVVQEATQIHTVLGLVGAGLGLALVPASSERLPRSGATLLSLRHPPKEVQVAVSWNPTRDVPARRQFLVAARAADRNGNPSTTG